MDQGANELARYVQGNHVDEPFAELRSAIISYYEENGSDAITSLTTSAGALANTYAYDPFGKLTASNGVIVNPFQYATRGSIRKLTSITTAPAAMIQALGASSKVDCRDDSATQGWSLVADLA